MIVNAIAWIGKKGAKAVAASLFLGIALPPLSALMRPVLVPCIFLLLVLAFVRVDLSAAIGHARRPLRLAAACFWMMVALPWLISVLIRLTGLQDVLPALAIALIVMAVAPPIMSAPAFAYLIGLDGALSLTVLVATMVLTPLTAPLMAGLLLGPSLPLSAADLAVRLAALLAGSMAVAAVLRRALGTQRIAEHRHFIDGLNVIMLFVFAVAIMDGVAAMAFGNPLLTLGLLALSFIAALLQMAATVAAFGYMGRMHALTLGLVAGNRNMGLMVAAMAGHVPDLAWIFFALAQFPIYLLPLLLQALARRLEVARG